MMRIKILFWLIHFNMLNFYMLVLLLLGIQVKSFSQSDSIILRDDFEREQLGETWHAYASWSIVDGSAYNYIDGTGGFLRSFQHFNDSAYVIETSAKGFTNAYKREFRITFGQTNLLYDSAYVLSYSPGVDGRFILAKSTDNILHPELLDEMVLYPGLEVEKWYKFKIAKYTSGLIQVYVDKGTGYSLVPLLEAIDTSYSKLGHLGWQEDTQTAAESFYVDWIEARKPEIDKPALKEKPVEDNLITQVSASSGQFYNVAKLQSGVKQYTDREYTITSVPDYLEGASFIQTANNDKLDKSTALLTSFIKKEAIIYIGYDPRATVLPAWLKDWQKTGDIIGTTDPEANYLEVYSKLIGYGQIYPRPFICGGNLEIPAEGAELNYLVIAVEKPLTTRLEAEDATLFGAVIDNKHPGFSGTGFVDYINLKNDYIEWTAQIDVPGSYNLGITFANGKDTERPLNLTVDGNEAYALPFSSTMNWASWAFQNGAAVYLTRGTHKIRATAISNSGPNVDLLSLHYSSSANLAAPYAKSAVPFIRDSNLSLEQTTNSSSITNAYPNPFDENTTIAYSLKEKMPVNLTIYDLQGVKMKVLVDGIQEAGNHKVKFDGSSLNKGLYISKLISGSEVKAVKLFKK